MCRSTSAKAVTRSLIQSLADAGGTCLLDVHADTDHNRSVLTLGGPLSDIETAARSIAGTAVATIDLTAHTGVHPRLGVLDVVPFVPLDIIEPEGSAWSAATAARDRFADWAGSSLGLPCFLYGPERTLPDVRRHAFTSLTPDTGPRVPHPTAGACAVGVRLPLVAYNVWITEPESTEQPLVALAVARAVAASLRGPVVRTLGLPMASGAQVSCNLIDPARPLHRRGVRRRGRRGPRRRLHRSPGRTGRAAPRGHAAERASRRVGPSSTWARTRPSNSGWPTRAG